MCGFVALAFAVAAMSAACGGGGEKKSTTWQPPEDDDIAAGDARAGSEGGLSATVSRGPAEVSAYTASEQGFLVSSYAIVDSGQILLVDAQLLRPDAQKYIAMVKQLGGKVTAIFITHPHPDHYLGLEWVSAAFPGAQVIAPPDVVEAIGSTGESTLRFLKSRKFMGGALLELLPSRVVVPKRYEDDDDTISVGKTELRILTFRDAEARVAHALFDPATNALFTGDLAYNKVHLWLQETPPEGWIQAIEELKQLGADRIYPGHGEPVGPAVLEEDIKYLRSFRSAIDSSPTRAELKRKVLERNPDWRVPQIVDMSAPTYKKK